MGHRTYLLDADGGDILAGAGTLDKDLLDQCVGHMWDIRDYMGHRTYLLASGRSTKTCVCKW